MEDIAHAKELGKKYSKYSKQFWVRKNLVKLHLL